MRNDIIDKIMDSDAVAKAMGEALMDELYLDGPKVMTASGSKNAAGLARVVVMALLEVAGGLQHGEFANIGCDS